MNLPFFYKPEKAAMNDIVVMDETASKHIIQVLRMTKGELLQITDGLGSLCTCVIQDDNRKKCTVLVQEYHFHPRKERQLSIAISLVKNNSRFEWFLEKATELGIHRIIPLLCTRTEKQHFRMDRMQGILVSAMLQSQQCWLPEISEPVKFGEWVKLPVGGAQKFIAHCLEQDEKKSLINQIKPGLDQQILIGPEGDFTEAEISLALEQGFIPVSLGSNRLRTETAGMLAAALFSLV